MQTILLMTLLVWWSLKFHLAIYYMKKTKQMLNGQFILFGLVKHFVWLNKMHSLYYLNFNIKKKYVHCIVFEYRPCRTLSMKLKGFADYKYLKKKS